MSDPATRSTARPARIFSVIGYFLAGIYFGIVLIKGQVADWFQIQQMFRFESFYMYGVLGSAVAVAVAMGSVWLLRYWRVPAADGTRIAIGSKPVTKGQVFGGLLFGIGWAATGACPGPLFAQLGAGFPVAAFAIGGALLGTRLYAWLQSRLPH